MDETFGIAEFPAARVVVARASCLHAMLGPTISELFDKLSSASDWVIGPPMLFYNAWRPNDCDIEAALPIGPDATPAGHEVKVIAQTQALLLEHRGSYEGLAATWERFWQQVNESGIQGLAPCWDRYVTDPGEEPDQSKWITELYIPVNIPKI